MPSLDMPLEQLKRYMGTNPKPDDFGEYWERALEELDSWETVYEIRESEFKTPNIICYDLTFMALDGAKIYSKLLVPKVIENPLPAIVEFHGYGGRSREWVTKLPLAEAGNIVLSMDIRDQMGESGDGDYRRGNLIKGLDSEDRDALYYRSVYLDAVSLIRIAMDMEVVDNSRIATLGISQGGAVALAAAALEQRVSKVFSVYPFLSDFKRVWDMDLGESPYEELKFFFRFKDPLHKREEEIFTKLGYIDIQFLAEKIEGEVTFATALQDRICPPSTQFATYNKIKTSKNMLIYPDFGHEDITGLTDIIYQWSLTL
ncbi:MAG: acetylxylan esterase [Fusobacteriaceae bacterium]